MARPKINYRDAISALGLNYSSSEEEIKEAYRKLAKQYHPDVYQLDHGERFKEISAAYRYLKKFPAPPSDSTSDSKKSTGYYSSQDTYARKRRAHYRRKRAKEAQRKKEMYLWLLRKLKPFVLTVFVFNVLLTLDYVLPYLKEDVIIINYTFEATRKSVLDPEEMSYEYAVLFNNNQDYRFEANQKKLINRSDKYTLEKTMFFGTAMRLKHHKTGKELTPVFGVYKIFGVIIPFVFLLQYLYFYKVKNFDLRLGLVAFMIISLLMQISLTFF